MTDNEKGLSGNLVIPIRIEAQYLAFDRMVSSPLADFTNLPWNDGANDINSDIPFLADNIMHQPFEDQNFLLGKGVHLHFILPHFLGQPLSEITKNENQIKNETGKLPAAPNRWLVTKKEFENGNIINQWIIESDYIYPGEFDPVLYSNEKEFFPPLCTIPFKPTEKDQFSQPYRYMGRTTLVSDTDKRLTGNTFKSLNNNNPLTVLGFGDINFSSFYPNCAGVFGFYDKDGGLTEKIIYNIIGWNDDSEDDLIAKLIAEYKVDKETDLQTHIKNVCKVDIGEKVNSKDKPRSVFCADIVINEINQNQKAMPDLKIAIGNNGTEALSALMASELTVENKHSKSELEEQLESFLMFSKLDHLISDTGPKFLEARHEKGFRSWHSGHIWKIVTQKDNNGNPDQTNIPELPGELAYKLHKLNLAQSELDKRLQKTETLREQLYLDWYKYMQAAYPLIEGRGIYPDPDHIRYFLKNYSMEELDKLVNDKSLKDAKKMGKEEIDIFLHNYNLVNENNPKLSLSSTPSPRFWQPNPPTILISGLPLHGADKDLNQVKKEYIWCHFSSESKIPLDINNKIHFDTKIMTEAYGFPYNYLDCHLLSNQVWNPFILDWEIELYLKELNLQDDKEGYHSEAFKKYFDLDQFGPDLLLNPGYSKSNTSGSNESRSIFSGSTIMSSHTRNAFVLNISSLLNSVFIRENIDFNKDTISDFLNAETLEVAMTKVKNADFISVLHTAWNAYHFCKDQNFISQILDGFNEACIMKNRTAQLPIEEPLGFQEAREFTKDVAGKFIGHTHHSSPITEFDFNPIRTGYMSINRLRLIDNFGIAHYLDLTKPTAIAETLKENVDSDNVFLKPRFAQPAKLHFRWLPAELIITNTEDATNVDTHITQTNDHPDTSPVCGWLMANYIDDTLAVFAADGTALGYLDNKAEWNILPWAKGVTDIKTNIRNAYLRNVIKWLIENGKVQSNWNDFLTATQSALNNIAPSNSHQFDSKAILMGRPMAVVMSSISFETKGNPAIDQSWPSLLKDLQHCDNTKDFNYDDRNNKGWTKIKLPVRIGEHHQLNDGLVGYWIHDYNINAPTKEPNGISDSKFITPEVPDTDIEVKNNAISTYSSSNHQSLWMALEDKPTHLCMLVDPVGVVHATTGLLPTKAISIPSDHFLNALKKINMWFKVSPLLQPVSTKDQTVVIDLPHVEGATWEWWDAFGGISNIAPDKPEGAVSSESKIIEGFITLTPAESNKISK